MPGIDQVDLAIACQSYQHWRWWSRIIPLILSEVQAGNIRIGRMLALGTATLDGAKNKMVAAWANEPRRTELADANRNAIVGVDANTNVRPSGFFDSDSEWIMWLDDDTLPPRGFITHLLSLRREFVSGIYYLEKPPHNPIAYLKDQDGFYQPVGKYPHGMLVPVDSVGMGCALIHKSLYQKIIDAYQLFMRPTGTLIPIHRDRIIEGSSKHFPHLPDDTVRISKEGRISLTQPLLPVHPDDTRPWPFYAAEYGRTEDHFFCELAASVGVRPYLDTEVVCAHMKMLDITRADYLEEMAKL